MKRSEELQNYLEGDKLRIEEVKNEILELGLKIGKAATKGNFDDVVTYNWSIKLKQEMIASREESIETLKELIEEAVRQESGLGIVSDALNEILQSDIEWHKQIRAEFSSNFDEFYAKYKKGEITPTTYNLAQMSEKMARKVFLDDLRHRFNTLKDRIMKKVSVIEEVNVRRNSNYSFDGYVKGTTGRANISTIIAGGYNIQRLHLRTLVK